jgi:predicted acyltransferase
MGSTDPRPTPTDRVFSLDAYRGFVMLLMISAGFGTKALLNDPAWNTRPVLTLSFLPQGWQDHLDQFTWGAVADQCEHRKWVGCTLWDLIQPSFMFLVGASMPFAFAKRKERGESWGRQFRHVLKRALLLVAIGVFLDSFGQPVVTVQFIRVLQQIAIGYVLAFLVLPLGPGYWIAAIVAVLALHTVAHLAFGVSTGFGPWGPTWNAGVALDHLIHGPFQNLNNPSILPPPKGDYAQLNALSSTATILFGVLAGELLRTRLSTGRKVVILLAAGTAGLLGGLLMSGGYRADHGILDMDGGIPAVKRIWTASFAVFAAGWTCLLLAVFHGVTEGPRWRGWAFPFAVAGMNSIALYVMSGTLRRPVESALRPFTDWKLAHLGPWGPVALACLATLVMWAMCFWLYRRRIFFKV